MCSVSISTQIVASPAHSATPLDPQVNGAAERLQGAVDGLFAAAHFPADLEVGQIVRPLSERQDIRCGHGSTRDRTFLPLIYRAN